LLYAIENVTRKKIELMELPSTDLINNRRIDKFKQRITDSLQNEDLSLFSRMIDEYQKEKGVPALQIAAALAQLAQGDSAFLLQNPPHRSTNKSWEQDAKPLRDKRARSDHLGRNPTTSEKRKHKPSTATRKNGPPVEGMQRYRIAVGHEHGVMPGNIVGAIANEADIDGQHIGRINIYDTYSLIDLPAGMPKETFNALKNVWVSGQKLGISRADDDKGHKSPARLTLPKGKQRKKKEIKPKRKHR